MFDGRVGLAHSPLHAFPPAIRAPSPTTTSTYGSSRAPNWPHPKTPLVRNILKEAGYEQTYDADEIIVRRPTPDETARLGIQAGTPVAEHRRALDSPPRTSLVRLDGLRHPRRHIVLPLRRRHLTATHRRAGASACMSTDPPEPDGPGPQPAVFRLSFPDQGGASGATRAVSMQPQALARGACLRPIPPRRAGCMGGGRAARQGSPVIMSCARGPIGSRPPAGLGFLRDHDGSADGGVQGLSGAYST